MKTAFIGSGNMARAIIGGMARAGVPAQDILVINPGNPASVAECCAFGAVSGSVEELSSCGAVVLAVKPQKFGEAAQIYAAHIAENALIISIMAGISTAGVAETLGKSRVIRVMPNLAHSVGLGASGYCLGAGACDEDAEVVEAMFSASGLCLRVEEDKIDDVAALSGSGTAYLCLLLESLRDAAVEDGLEPATAALLARQTLVGTAALLAAEDIAPEELRARVSSKKGTTEAAIGKMRELGLPEAVKAGYRANKARSAELAKS